MNDNFEKCELKELSLRRKLRMFADRSTFHGIPNIVATERTSLKILWAICLLVMAGLCSKTLITNIMDYMKFDVETVVEILRDNDAYFPTVSFCNMQLCELKPEFQFNKYWDIYVREELNKTGNLTPSSLETIKKTLNLKTISEAVKNTYLKTEKTDLNKYFSQNKSSIREMLISCQYSSEFCYENDFEYFQMSQFQRCYKFNSGKLFNGSSTPLRKAKRYGKNYGLQLELYVGIPDNCKSPFSSTSGVTLYVHNFSYNVADESNGIQLAPSTETNIAVDRTFVSRKPSPYSDCIQNNITNPDNSNKFIDQTLQLNQFYTQQSCLELCYQDYVITSYNCYDPYVANVNFSVPVCPNILDSLNNSFYYNKTAFYNGAENDKCLEFCRNECEYVTYETTVSSAEFPTITYQEVLIYNENISGHFADTNRDYSLIKSSVLSVNVFYKTDLYTKIREKASMEFEVFISTFGGTLGLFLGISLLSLVEIFEVAIEVILTFIEKNFLLKKTNKIIDVKPSKT